MNCPRDHNSCSPDLSGGSLILASVLLVGTKAAPQIFVQVVWWVRPTSPRKARPDDGLRRNPPVCSEDGGLRCANPPYALRAYPASLGLLFRQ
jgi:hypothetical protein